MLRIVSHTVPLVGRSYAHFPDGFELNLLRQVDNVLLELVLATALREEPGAACQGILPVIANPPP